MSAAAAVTLAATCAVSGGETARADVSGPDTVSGMPWTRKPVTQACLWGTTGDGTVTNACANGGVAEFLLRGTHVDPRMRQVTFVTERWQPRVSETALLMIDPGGRLTSVVARNRVPDRPLRDGETTWRTDPPRTLARGLTRVRSIAVPHDLRAPYTYLLDGSALRRYTLRMGEQGVVAATPAPVAAASGFGRVRGLTWIRSTSVKGTPADVLVGLVGDGLVQYTVPRTPRPRIGRVVLMARGWGAYQAVRAGGEGFDTTILPHGQAMILAAGRDVRILFDQDNSDSSARYSVYTLHPQRLSWTPR